MSFSSPRLYKACPRLSRLRPSDTRPLQPQLQAGQASTRDVLKCALKAVDPKDYDVVFSVQNWAPFASLSSIFDEHQSIDAGYAVNVWRPRHFLTGVKYPQVTEPINNVFTGINVDVGVRDNDAFICKLSYNITLLGTIAFAATGSLGG